MDQRIAEIVHDIAERHRMKQPHEIEHPLTPVEVAWERYRQATIRYLAAGEERDRAYAEFEKLFLTDK